jgi:hypothetical protein
MDGYISLEVNAGWFSTHSLRTKKVPEWHVPRGTGDVGPLGAAAAAAAAAAAGAAVATAIIPCILQCTLAHATCAPDRHVH